MQMNRTNAKLAVLLSFLGCVGIINTVAMQSDSIAYSNSFFALLFFGISVYMQLRIVPLLMSASRREVVYASVFSLLLAAALVWGSTLEVWGNVNFANISLYLKLLCVGAYLTPVTHACWEKLSKTDVFFSEADKAFGFFQTWGLIFVLWIPTFLALFPGAFVYDATDEYIEVISREFTTHHPLIHVLLLGGMTHLGEYLGLGANAGIAAYTIIQMLVVSMVFAYAIRILQKWGLSSRYCFTWIIIIGLFPVYPMYAVCSAKDTLFSSAFLMLTLLLMEFVRDRERFFDVRMVYLVIAATLMMLLRNNGVYALLVAVPFIVICAIAAKVEHKTYIKLVLLIIISFVMYKGVNYSLKLVTDASDTEHQEMLTVPIQQLARVYKYAPETFTQEEADTLHEILPENYLVTYNPVCSDILKSGFDNAAYAKDSAKYRQLWWKIFTRKPMIYINAWLVNSYGYWYPDMVINVYGGNEMYTFQYKDSSYFGFETEPPGTRHSLFPLYEKFYRNISLELFQQRVPVVSMLFSPGFMFVMFAYAFMYMMRQRRWLGVGILMPMLLLWGTVLLGPTVLVRYVLIFWFAASAWPLAFRSVRRS